jgi:hypothetical protein
MSQQQEQFEPEDGQPIKDGSVQQQQQQPSEGHAGHRASNSVGRHRHGQ